MTAPSRTDRTGAHLRTRTRAAGLAACALLALAALGVVGVGPTVELQATDTISELVTGGSAMVLIVGLAGLALVAVLFFPAQRPDDEVEPTE